MRFLITVYIQEGSVSKRACISLHIGVRTALMGGGGGGGAKSY